MLEISASRRDEILTALRNGTVPGDSLDALAVGLGPFVETIDAELDVAADRRAVFKAVRGEYGSGKTFFVRWVQQRARERGFAASEVQISETETPLHKMEIVYRRLVENLSTGDTRSGALRSIVDSWFFGLEEEVCTAGTIAADDQDALLEATNELMEKRLVEVTREAPAFAACLRGYRAAVCADEKALAEGLIAWLGGSPNVAGSIKRAVGIRGEIDHYGALGFLRGLLTILLDSGHGGLVLVLDEIETIQRVRTDIRDKALNALRQLMDEVQQGRFSGLYLMVTGTPSFYDGHNGVQRLQPLAQRLHVDFATDRRFDNPRAVQIRLGIFDFDRLLEVSIRVRDLFVSGIEDADTLKRVSSLVDDAYLADFARAIAGELGGDVGITPRLCLKKLVADVLDRAQIHADFDPRKHYRMTLDPNEMSEIERNAVSATSVDDIELDVDAA